MDGIHRWGDGGGNGVLAYRCGCVGLRDPLALCRQMALLAHLQLGMPHSPIPTTTLMQASQLLASRS